MAVNSSVLNNIKQIFISDQSNSFPDTILLSLHKPRELNLFLFIKPIGLFTWFHSYEPFVLYARDIKGLTTFTVKSKTTNFNKFSILKSHLHIQKWNLDIPSRLRIKYAYEWLCLLTWGACKHKHQKCQE